MLHPLLTIFQKIHQANTDRSTATDLILRHYFQAQTTVVSFVYFLPLSSLFHKSYTQHDTNYIQALEKSDFILPDGIGLQFFWYWCMRSWIPNCTRFLANLNGTDFVPYLMNCVIEKYNKSHTCQLICYGSKKSVVHKVADLFQSQGREILSAQDGYQEFNRNALKNTSTNEKNLIRILLVARGTPLQEIRSMHHAQQIKNYKLLVIHV
jgi:UDP-N-acetyl-D-mannosaminuronic acid transferase (WecB/TagA/CpsF family)